MYYDPMIAKVIAYGETRQHALQRMIQALRQTVIVGLTTNQNFLIQVPRLYPGLVVFHVTLGFLTKA
jgi:acetyl/propionyl-CoA carboxylase alpha subunit